MNALSTITIMPSNEEELASYKKALKSEILKGAYNPLEILNALKFAQRAITDTLTDPDIVGHFNKVLI